MGTVNEINLIEILEKHLEQEMKTQVVNAIVKKHTEMFEKDLREKVLQQVEDITLSGVYKCLEMWDMKEKVTVVFNWNPDK